METQYNIDKRGLIIMTSFSVFYALLKIGINWDPKEGWLSQLINKESSLYFYRFLYTAIFLYPSYLASRKIFSINTIWYFIYGSMAEDIIYWIFLLKVPYTWAWFYPVINGIPIPDVIEGILLLIILYHKRVLNLLRSIKI